MGDPVTAASAPRPGLSTELIVDTALRLIARDGADSLSMRQLSAELGVSLGATYRHVDSKDELLVLCGRRLYARSFLERVPGSDPLVWVRDQVMHFYDLLRAHPGMADHTLFAGNVDPDLSAAVRASLVEAGHSEANVEKVGLILTLYTAGALMAANRPTSPHPASNTRELIVSGIDFILRSYASDEPGSARPSEA